MESDATDSSETNSVLNPTFHDVEIKLVSCLFGCANVQSMI